MRRIASVARASSDAEAVTAVRLALASIEPQSIIRVYRYDPLVDALVRMDVTPSRGLTRAEQPVWQAFDKGKLVWFDAKLDALSGIAVPLQSGAETLGVLEVEAPVMSDTLVAAAEDIAAVLGLSLGRLHAANLAISRQEMLEVIADMVPAGIIVATEQGELFLGNRRLEELCGWTFAELREKGWFECVYPDSQSRARAVASVRAAFQGAPAVGIPWRLTHKSGRQIDVLLSSRVFTDIQGRRWVAGTFQSMESPDSAHTDERSAAQYVELSRLAAAVAGDFNNLVSIIQGNAELLRRRHSGEVGERALLISDAAVRAAQLTRQLLAFGRDQPMWLTPTDLGAVCEEQVRQSQEIEGGWVQLTIEPGCPPVDLDPHAFSLVLLNLIANARDAGGAQQPVYVSVASALPPAAPTRSWAKTSEHRWVRLRVQDQGPGFSDEARQHLFEPFFTTRAAGHGLGLPAVAAVARVHGAIIDVPLTESGAIFDLYFPAAIRPGLPEPARRNPDAGGTERIWVVDDEDGVREYLTTALSSFGYQCESFASGSDVLVALEGGGRFDLLVTDVSMPEMDGVELHYAIRSHGLRRPVLFVSGYSERGSAVPRERDTDFLQKPCSIRVLAQRVRRLLNYLIPRSGV